MYAWAAYLQGQADALKLEVIDTTGLSIKESALLLAESIDSFFDFGKTGKYTEFLSGSKE